MQRRSWSRGVAAAAAVLSVLSVGVMAAAQAPGHGRHTDAGRFTAQSAGFPPQPRGAEDGYQAVVPLRESVAVDRAAAVQTANGDTRVRRALRGGATYIGVVASGPKDGPATQTVTWFVRGRDVSVRAVLRDGAVVSVAEIPAAEWQPPLVAEEVDEAIAIAREHWLEAGETAVERLEGFAILDLEADGTDWPMRVAYVTFHEHVDARPELLAWVDLSAGAVFADRIER